MAWQPLGIGSKCYRPRSGTQSIERLINLYPEASQQGAKTAFTLYGTPGLKPWSTAGNGPIRGLRSFGSDLYVVSGQRAYAIDVVTKAATDLGFIDGTGAVSMTDNGTHVVIATSGNAYAINRTSYNLLPVTNLSAVMYQDGYVIATERGTQNFWISALDDATTWGGLDFSTADAFADNLVGGIAYRRELYLFGEKSTEHWFNSGAAAFPFSRSGAGVMERGCFASSSIAVANGLVYWLGDDLRVYRAEGYQPIPVSTSDIDRLISGASSPADASAFSYTQEGHTFYALSFGDLTLVYDTTTGSWHERESYGLGRWIANCQAYADNKNIVGHYNGNSIYELDLDTYDEDGEPLVRTMISPPLHAGALPVFVHEMFLDAQMGVGLTSGQGSDPVVMLSWSDDDGNTWSSDIDGGLGALGVRRYRTTFTRLGRSRNRSWRFRISDPVKVAVLGAEARFDVGAQ